MATPNRAAIINQTIKVLRKHFKPAPPLANRTVLESLLYACCVENSDAIAAERVFQSLSNDYFDWNEVRVSSVRELADVMRPLNDPEDAARRLKRSLQSVFEAFYTFDLEAMRKQNLGQSVKQLERLDGTTPFVVAFVAQTALNGHAIPVNNGLLVALHTLSAISDNELKKKVVPGLERAVPKNKGHEYGSLLHQLGVAVGKSPYGPAARKLLLDIDPKCKDRLPKRPAKPKPQPAPPARAAAKKSKAAAAKKTADKAAKKPAKKAAPAKGKKTPTKKPVKKKKVAVKKKAAPAKGKKTAKTVAKKKKKTATRSKRKGSTARLAKRKPR